MRLVTLLILAAVPAQAGPQGTSPPWPPERTPVQLSVRTPDDLAFKIEVEQLYLAFNLVAGGKVAFDARDYDEAIDRWENALRVPRLPEELKELLPRWIDAAKARAEGTPRARPEEPSATPSLSNVATTPQAARAAAPPSAITVSGTITGGGPNGPGGAVVLLRRVDGATPRPPSGRVRRSVQKGKRFIPHVMVVPVGGSIDFRNEDEVFHNVFSLSKTNGFDLALYDGGASRVQTFTVPGPVEILCNIHSAMQAWVYVSDTPWYGQADGSGRFTVRGVPPGDYAVEVWHEWSTRTVSARITVEERMAPVSLAVEGDRQPPAFVPDKSGKPRQPNLGY